MALRLLSYLAPSLPAGLFETLADHLARSLGTEIRLTFETRRSGPRAGEREPFDRGEVDVAFVCATSYVWLTDDPAPAIDLVGAAWAPTDPRSAGAAVYFADVLTSRAAIEGLGGLAGHRVAYNDEVSLSGFHSLLLTAHQSPTVAAALADAELRRFVAVDDHDFAGLRADLAIHDHQPVR